MRSIARPLAAAALPALAALVGCTHGARPDAPPVAGASAAGAVTALPLRYEEHRFFVRPVTLAGDTLTLYTDTGGGLWMTTAAAERAGMTVRVVGMEGKDTLRAARLPAFRDGASIPEPLGSDSAVVYMTGDITRGTDMDGWSGMLGQQWFAGRVWTFDYPGKRLLLRPAMPAHDAAHTVALGFRTSPSGRRQTNFPRVRVVIDGDTLDLLFDTGAYTSLTPEALATMGGAPTRATSFIAANVFERWRSRHPDWRVVPRAERGSGMAMIEVPAVTVAGYTVGPVWFTYRPDPNFHSYMSQWMDRRVEGALGGSALHYFRVTVDYPNAMAWFER